VSDAVFRTLKLLLVVLATGCSPISNMAVRKALAPGVGSEDAEADVDSASPADTGESPDGCPVVFDDAFDDEAGVEPPTDWVQAGSHPEPIAVEEGGTVTLQVDGGTSRIVAFGVPALDVSEHPVVVTVDVVELVPGGPDGLMSFSLIESTELIDTVAVFVSGDGGVELRLEHGDPATDSRYAVFLEEPFSYQSVPFSIELRFDATHFRIRSDHGFDSGLLAVEAFAPGWTPDRLDQVFPNLQATSLGSPEDTRVVVDRFRVATGPDCPTPGDGPLDAE